jgi:hypothetical protein
MARFRHTKRLCFHDIAADNFSKIAGKQGIQNSRKDENRALV